MHLKYSQAIKVNSTLTEWFSTVQVSTHTFRHFSSRRFHHLSGAAICGCCRAKLTHLKTNKQINASPLKMLYDFLNDWFCEPSSTVVRKNSSSYVTIDTAYTASRMFWASRFISHKIPFSYHTSFDRSRLISNELDCDSDRDKFSDIITLPYRVYLVLNSWSS